MHRTWRLAIIVLATLVPHASAAEPKNNAVYVEAFGKGGLWGIGVDHRLARRVTTGVVASAQSIDGQRYVSVIPYVGVYLARYGRSAWFADVGAQFAHVWTKSPVPEWDGESSTGVGGTLSTGYEFRGRLVARVFVHGVVGKGGALPWAGAGVGCTF